MQLVTTKPFRLHGRRYWWAEWLCAHGVLHAQWLSRKPVRQMRPKKCGGHA